MPRAPRIESPDATHHVVAKANAGAELVRDDIDRRTLWIRLARTTERHRWRCLAYCLMDTHLHVVVRTPDANLGRGMQWLCGLYAQDFNSRYDRSGHVFGGRFYSTLVSSDEHLVAAVVYVLLNPVRAGIVKSPELWPWSSYAATVGIHPAPSFLDVEGVLSYVGDRPSAARERLAHTVLETMRRPHG